MEDLKMPQNIGDQDIEMLKSVWGSYSQGDYVG